MRFSDRSKRTPHVKPVIRLELEDGKTRSRVILVLVLLAIGAIALIYGLFGLLNTQPGWQAIEASSTQRNCSQDFVINYDFSDVGGAASAQYKQLSELYGEASERAFQVFTPDEQPEGVHNLRYLNDHLNEAVTVDEILYDALSLVHEYGNRAIYLAPVYVEYNRIFYSESEAQAIAADPGQNPEQMRYITELAAYANDPDMIDIELLDENQVCLHVSDTYLAFTEENEIETVVDFGWMKNAFIADYLAEVMTENGFSSGYLSSYDGFTRNLDRRDTSYSVNLFDRMDQSIHLAAVMEYDTPMSIVFLRDYPMYDVDRWSYYSFSDGRIATPFIDPKDGVNKCSIDSLVCYSGEASCGEILLQMFPVFVADAFSEEQLLMLEIDGIYSLWCESAAVFHNEKDARLVLQPEKSGIPYTVKFTG